MTFTGRSKWTAVGNHFKTQRLRGAFAVLLVLVAGVALFARGTSPAAAEATVDIGKVPGTPEGLPAIEELTRLGVNVNVTLLFDVKAYEKAAQAYITGLERRLEAGESIEGVSGVASFFISRVDTAVDALLPEESPLRGKVAVANAKLAYQRFRSVFSGPRWDRLAAVGGRLQRPLWASTGTKNPSYSDVLYVGNLSAPTP